MARNRRDISIDPPRFALVSPEGLIKMVAVAENIKGALEIVAGRVVLAREHEQQGWAFLEKLYADIGRSDLWRAWQEHREALTAARRMGRTIAAFPDEYLPPEVRKRRAGQRPNAFTWQMPALEPALDPSEAKPARKSKDV